MRISLRFVAPISVCALPRCNAYCGVLSDIVLQNKNSVYLPTKKIGKNNPKTAEIEADNAARQERNKQKPPQRQRKKSIDRDSRYALKNRRYGITHSSGIHSLISVPAFE